MDTTDRLNKNLDYLTREINARRYSIAFTGCTTILSLGLTIGSLAAGYIFLPWLMAMITLGLIVLLAKDNHTLTILTTLKAQTSQVREARVQLDKDIDQAIAQVSPHLNHQH